MMKDGLVDVDGAFRHAGSAAGEMQYGHSLRIRRANGELVAGLGHELWQRVNPILTMLHPIDNEDSLQMRQPVPQQFHLRFVKLFGGDQEPGLAFLHSLEDRFGAEGGEEWAEDGPSLEGAQGGDVERGQPAGQRKGPVPLGDAQALQHVGKTISLLLEFTVGDIGCMAVFIQETESDMVSLSAQCMTINGLVRDIQTGAAR